MLALQRLLAAALIFVPLVAYVYGIQVEYDKINITRDPVKKAALFVAALVLGSATYDFAKHALFMKSRSFKKFFGKLIESWASILFMLIFTIFTSWMMSDHTTFPQWVAVVSFFGALCCVGWFVISLTAAIESAAA